MKWFVNLGIQFKSKFPEQNHEQETADLEKGKQLFLSSKFDEALYHLDNALNSGFNSTVYELRARCFQKLNYHYKAIEDFDKVIEDNPLEFSYYYNRAISKNAISDLSGQIEDLHNCIYYYKKNKNIENHILKNLETDLKIAGNYVEGVKNTIASIHNISYLEIKNLINDCLVQIKKIKPHTRRFKTLKTTESIKS
jgi:tetratricopeptide (TPR) repeat protein